MKGLVSVTLAPPSNTSSAPAIPELPDFLEFFAGSGLVAYGLRKHFRAAWANDICPKKAAVYTANHGSHRFHLGSISDVRGISLPPAALAWASFPCQDLSLAGLTRGIQAQRSGLVWQWLRIIDEMIDSPSILIAENVTGLISTDGGSHYRILHQALSERGYAVGAIVLDAVRWVPQSRARVFVIAVKNGVVIPSSLTDIAPNWLHSKSLVNAVQGLKEFIWWKAPEPSPRKTGLEDIIEWNVECDAPSDAEYKFSLIPATHKERLKNKEMNVVPGYRRTRKSGQVLELRFDGVAGCLRTAEGGSSRQVIILKRGETYDTRLLSVRETARLMGAPESYKLPGSYNDGYTAMGDAVATPVVRHLARHILSPLADVLPRRNSNE